jgi:hypothetical protein
LAIAKGAEGQLGVLEKADTSTPELVISTAKVSTNA